MQGDDKLNTSTMAPESRLNELSEQVFGNEDLCNLILIAFTKLGSGNWQRLAYIKTLFLLQRVSRTFYTIINDRASVDIQRYMFLAPDPDQDFMRCPVTRSTPNPLIRYEDGTNSMGYNVMRLTRFTAYFRQWIGGGFEKLEYEREMAYEREMGGLRSRGYDYPDASWRKMRVAAFPGIYWTSNISFLGRGQSRVQLRTAMMADGDLTLSELIERSVEKHERAGTQA